MNESWLPHYLPTMPADLRDILDNDRRLKVLKHRPGDISRPRVDLEPKGGVHPIDERYALTYLLAEEGVGNFQWKNAPPGIGLYRIGGGGRGLGRINERPQVFETGELSANRPDILPFGGWFAVSPRFVSMMKALDADAIEVLPVDWHFKNGSVWEGASFLDFTRLVDAYDYRRSALSVELADSTRVYSQMLNPRALKSTVPASAHVFRDSYNEEHLFVSMDFVRAFDGAAMGGAYFESLITGGTVTFRSGD